MPVDISVRTEPGWGAEDRRWTQQKKGYDSCLAVTLDVSTFLPAHFSAKGAIPSGTALGRITATGLYAPFDPAYDADAVTAGQQGDGREVFAGLLLNTTPVFGYGDLATAPNVAVALMWEGVIDLRFLPKFDNTAAGELPANPTNGPNTRFLFREVGL